MESRIGADPPASPRAGYDAVEAALAEVVQRNGPGVLQRSGHVRRLLAEACPDAQTEIALIIAAMSAEVPQRLRVARNDDRLPTLLRDTAKHLQDQAALDAGLAAWAVGTWARALSLPTTGLSAATTTMPSTPQVGKTVAAPDMPSAPGAPIMPAPPPVARPRARRAAPDDRPAIEPVGNPAVPSPTPRVAKRSAPPHVARPAPSPAPPGRPDSPVEANRAPVDAAHAILLEPLFSDHDLARMDRSTGRAGPTRRHARRHAFATAFVTAGTCAALAMAGYFARDVMRWFEHAPPSSARGVVLPAPTVIVASPPMRPTGDVVPERDAAGPRAPSASTGPSETGAAEAVVPAPGAVDASSAQPAPQTQRGDDGLDPQAPGPARVIEAPKEAEAVASSPAPVRSSPAIERNRLRGVGGSPEPCTAASCGTIVESHEVRAGTPGGPSVYDITVRLDNRQSRSFAATYRLQTGSRVRVVGDRLVPVETSGR